MCILRFVMKPWKRRVLIILAMMTATYGSACVYVWTNQVQMIFLPEKAMSTNPGRIGMTYKDVRIPVGGGTDKLHGFWVGDGVGDETELNNTQTPVVLFFHGRNTTIGKNLGHTHSLYELGCRVLLIDYRGFGQSFGTQEPSESKAYEDAQAAWSYLTEVKRIDPSRIFIMGHSLGGAVAIELATKCPQAAGVIVESTFTNALDMSNRNYNGWLQILPIDRLLHQRFDSISKIGTLELPVLLIHGKDDIKIDYTMSERLYAAAREPKDILLIKGADHATCGFRGRVEYREKLKTFLGKY
jgi:dipeptidyl aminopeptidase/acylaminoacyl peptidase